MLMLLLFRLLLLLRISSIPSFEQGSIAFRDEGFELAVKHRASCVALFSSCAVHCEVNPHTVAHMSLPLACLQPSCC